MPEVGMPPFSGILSENQTRQMLVFLRDGAARLAESPPFVPSLDGVEINSDKQSFTIELLVSGLDVPWALDFLPDGRKLVTERTGYLRIIDADNNLLSEPVSGMPEAYVVQDGGYLDVAVDPDYENNSWVYVSYVEVMPGYVAPEEPELDRRGRPMNPPMNTVAMRGRINSSNEWVDEEVLFRAAEDMYTTSGAHFGSRFLFDDEGHLFSPWAIVVKASTHRICPARMGKSIGFTRMGPFPKIILLLMLKELWPLSGAMDIETRRVWPGIQKPV